MNAVGYCRVSSVSQIDNTSLEDQAILIKEYCKNNNIVLSKTFVEKGRSAFTFNRPEWRDLETYIVANNCQLIIVKNIDRFSRATLLDALQKIQEIEGKLKVKIITVNDRPDVNHSDLSGQLLRTLQLLLSNNERNVIQARIKDGIYRSLTQGRFINAAPFGYLNSKNGKPLLTVDESKAPIVRKVFEMYANGVPKEAIRKDLKLFNKGNSFITNMLSRSVYAGLIDVPAYKQNKPYQTTALHEPIISKALYFKVQAMAKKSNKMHGNDDVWLRGILSCHLCGKMLTAGRSKGRNGFYWYYKCGTHRVNFSASLAHDRMNKIIESLSLPMESIERIKAALTAQVEQREDKADKLELVKVKKQIDNLQEKFLSVDGISPEIFKRKLAELKMQETELESRLNVDNSQIYQKLMAEIGNLSDLSQLFERMPMKSRQEFIKVVLSYPLPYSGQLFYIEDLNPLFADNFHLISQLPFVEINKKGAEIKPLLPGTLIGSVGQLLMLKPL